MDFSELKARTLSPKKEKAVSTFFIALFTAMCLFVPYMIMSEGYFTFYGDFNVQQIPFYQRCHQLVREGSIFWDFGTDLGANFIGSYSFYLLGSPFFWLTIPFPNSFVPYLMGPLLILKFALAALTAYFYIRRFTRTPEAARLGGLLYAFSGFSVYNIFFNHFHEAIILFPLLLLSFELLVTENKRFGFALCVCICAVSNYFFFFGMVVFVVIYYFVRLFSGAFSFKFSRFLAIVFEAVLGLALSAFLLLPSIAAITGNYRISEFLLGWDAIMYGKEQIYGNILQCFFFPPDIPARPVFFPGAEVRWSSLGGWLPLFSMVGVFNWFKYKKNTWLKRTIGICIFMALVPILNSAFYAFNTSYYARWYYMPILLMALATVSLTEDKEIDWSYGYKWVLGITVAVSLVVGLFPQKNDNGIEFGLFTKDKPNEYTFILRFIVACVIAVVSLIILGMLLKIFKNNRKSFYTASVACVCIISIVYGNVFIASGRAHSYKIKEVVIDSLIEGKVDFDDDTEFRIDTFDCVDNTAMYLGYSSINAFHSVVPASIMEYYEAIGVERSVGSRPETDYPSIRSLLSVKYLVNRMDGKQFIDTITKEPAMQGYNYIGTQSGYYIYENENYIPYGFSYDYYVDEEYFESYIDTEQTDLMLKAMLLTDEQIEKYKGILKNFEDLAVNYTPNGDSPSVYFDYESLKADCERLRATSAINFKTDKNGFSATVERERENLVFFSIPYDEGWSATVNGKPCEIEKVNVGFMAVKVPAGTSDIRFNYQTPGLKMGLIVTVIAAAVFLVYMLVFLITNKLRPTKNKYPEGKILIKQWVREEVNEQYDTEEIVEKSESLLDKVMDIKIPKIENGFKGGFTIIPTEDEKE